ncbi:hypothetical protein [Marinactinospora rubrisoli]|uniref:DUF3830 domain-containing protein n=1 Tax=Marinactinospora rubrisoli TaxID=2715399 RepID=A0ABW2KFP1_9ACTN
MIKASPGHRVCFEPRPGTQYRRGVEAWADDGHPLVVQSTGLVRAETISGYVGVEMLPDGDPVPFAFLPGGGWMVEHPTGDREPIVGWAVCTYGGGTSTFAVPMTTEEEAWASEKITLAKMVERADSVEIVPPEGG